MNKLLFLCTPGLVLDNVLPLAKNLNKKNKVDILIMKVYIINLDIILN